MPRPSRSSCAFARRGSCRHTSSTVRAPGANILVMAREFSRRTPPCLPSCLHRMSSSSCPLPRSLDISRRLVQTKWQLRSCRVYAALRHACGFVPSPAPRHGRGSFGERRGWLASIFLDPRIHVCIGTGKSERNIIFAFGGTCGRADAATCS